MLCFASKYTIDSIVSRRCLFVAAAMLVSLFATSSQAVDEVNIHFTNKSDNDLVAYGTHVTFDANNPPIGYSAKRWNPTTKEWVDESNLWDVTEKKAAGEWDLLWTPKEGTPPVTKGTKMIFDVKYAHDPTGNGYSGSVKKYAPNPCPKKGTKKSVDKKEGQQSSSQSPQAPFLATLDCVVYYGGTTGRSVPGLNLNVPANMYAYLYQVNALQGPGTIVHMRLTGCAPYFSSFSQMGTSHNGAIDSLFIGPTIPPTALDPHSPAVFETAGSPGVAATSWGVEGANVFARFTGLTPGQSSNILVAMSSQGPGLPQTGFNAYVADASGEVGNTLWTPPEGQAIPSLSRWGMTALIALLVGFGALVVHRMTA